MSVLLFEDKSAVGGRITALDINGQGSQAFLKPLEPLRINGKYRVQNSKQHPTNTVQILLFLDSQFFKCVYNDIPPAEPDAEEGTFSLSCHAPEEVGRHVFRSGWGYNWPWPEDAYKHLLTKPMSLIEVGELVVGFQPEALVPSMIPYLALGIPALVLIGLGVGEK